MYEETKSSIDWKGILLKVIIAFLIVLIAVKGYTTLKGENNNKAVETTTETTAESKSSATFTENIEKLRNAGEEYYSKNTNKLPEEEGNTTMVTLNELIDAGVITTLSDEYGKTCDGESSYVTALKEGEKTKIKANLVCGSASSYSLVYMGENDAETAEKETTTSTSTSYSNTSSSSSSSKKTTSTSCSTSTCTTPSVTVNTNVSQKVSINSDSTSGKTSSNNSSSNSTNTKTTYYTVSFDSNGGSRQYASQTVKKNNTAYNPGSTTKNGYTFVGWYLNGSRYDFSTPVTRNITLTAKFTYNDNYDYNYDYDYDYRDELVTATYYSYVYTMGWDTYGTDYISIDHTLRLPEYLEEKDIEKAKISDITFYKAINTASLAQTYRSEHRDTFFYEKNGWESTVNTANSLATIKSNAVEFDYSSRYKSLDDALDDGYEVNWTADDVYKQCKTTFSVNGETNKCNYGIVYKVKWTYQYYR